MKHFRYKVEDDEIKGLIGEVETIPPGYIEMNNSMGADRIYYKITGGKITEAIGEAIHEPAAHRRVEEFISSFNVNLF